MIRLRTALLLIIIPTVILVSCTSIYNLPQAQKTDRIALNETAENRADSRAGIKETIDEQSSASFETIMPGSLTVGYTDIYVDGYLNQDDTGPHGLDSELAELLAEYLGLEIDWLEVPRGDDYFQSIVAALNAYKVDMFISVTSILPEREKHVLFSIPYTYEGAPLGISIRKDNKALKAVIDPHIEQLIAEGSIEMLEAEWVEPVENIYETDKIMRMISGHYFVESCVIGDQETAPLVRDTIDISYDKWWEEYPLEGSRNIRMKLLNTGYGQISGVITESRFDPDSAGAEFIYKVDMQQLEKTDRWVSEIFDPVEGKNIGRLIMMKGE